MRCVLFLFINSILFFSSSAQNYVYEWHNTDYRVFEKFDLKSQKIYQRGLLNSYSEGEPIEVLNLDLRDIPFDNHIFLNGFNFSKSITYFTMPGTGFVFEYNRATKVFKRIDNTFYKGYNFNALQFIKDGKIYSLGGSGFWKIHATCTVYNFKSGEWDLVRTKGDIKPERVLGNLSGFHTRLNKVYVLEPTPEYENNTVGVYRFFELNVADFTWEYKGLVDIRKFAQYNLSTFNLGWIGEYFYFKDRQENELVIDPVKNEMLLFKGANDLFWGLEQQNFYSNGYVYSLEPEFTRLNSRLQIDSIPLAKFPQYFEKIDNFYETPRLNWSRSEILWSIIIACMVSISVVYIGVKNKQRKDTKSSSNQKLTNTVWDFLPNGGEQILDFVLEHGSDYLFNTDEISKLLGCDKKAFDTQRQYRSKFITHFNQYFDEQFGIDQAIYRITSEEDKRFVCYQISDKAVKAYKNKE